MKSSEFAILLRTLGEAFQVAGALPSRDQVVLLSTAFEVAPNSNVSAAAKRLGALPASQGRSSPTLGDVVRLMLPIRKLMEQTAKVGALKDFVLVESLLRSKGAESLHSFVRSAIEQPQRGTATKRLPKGRRQNSNSAVSQPGLVDDYCKTLEASLGDENKFHAIYNKLQSDTAIGKSELVLLAKKLTGGSIRTKTEALKKIWGRHQSLLAFKAKANATGGRSAA